jgi:hypothetical protein
LNVLFWAILVVIIGFGVVCLVFGYRAPADKAPEAAKPIRGGYGLIAGGVGMYAVRRLFGGYSW